jgi:hypothetical protein
VSSGVPVDDARRDDVTVLAKNHAQPIIVRHFSDKEKEKDVRRSNIAAGRGDAREISPVLSC